MKRQTAADRLEKARQRGYEEGYRTASSLYEAKMKAFSREHIDAKIRLINAVGQAMNVNSTLINGLAQALDNSGNLS